MLERLEKASNRVLRFNPCVMTHELRLRMRTKSVYWVMLLFALVCACAAAVPFVVSALERASGGGGRPVGEVGRLGVLALALTLLTLTLLVLPAWAASGIAGERERDTLGVLRSTMLSASDVVMGKFGATITYALLLLGVSLPVAAWCIMLGAISPREVGVIYATLISFSLGVAGIGTWMSALCRKVISAVVGTYVILVAAFGLPVFAEAMDWGTVWVWWQFFGLLILAVIWIGPAAIFAWALAAFVRGLVMRTGRLVTERSRAFFAIVVFGLVMVGLASVEEVAGVLAASGIEDTAIINPFVGCVLFITEDTLPWQTVGASVALMLAGCMGAIRCLRLREFHPVYVDDIFISGWQRVRDWRTRSVEA